MLETSEFVSDEFKKSCLNCKESKPALILMIVMKLFDIISYRTKQSTSPHQILISNKVSAGQRKLFSEHQTAKNIFER